MNKRLVELQNKMVDVAGLRAQTMQLGHMADNSKWNEMYIELQMIHDKLYDDLKEQGLLFTTETPS